MKCESILYIHVCTRESNLKSPGPYGNAREFIVCIPLALCDVDRRADAFLPRLPTLGARRRTELSESTSRVYAPALTGTYPLRGFLPADGCS